MGLDNWLQRIASLHPVQWDPGLERVASVGKRLDVLVPAPTIFLVAGTNGKGSTCAAIAALCMAKELRVGVTTSPHLVRFNERIVIDGSAAADDEICAAFARIDAARRDTSLSYFEFAALAAMDIFKRRCVDVAVLEIGLGGRLDAMNIVEPDVSVITRIAIDHEAWLGHDRESIAREKAGILRPGKPCVIADERPPESLGLRAAEVAAKPVWVNTDFGQRGTELYVRGGADTLVFDDPGQPALPMPSLLAAIQATTLAGLAPTQAEVDWLFREVRLAGRFQQLAGPRLTIFDVAHNPDAADWLARRLADVKPASCRAVFGIYRDKDYAAVIDIMSPLVDAWYLCRIDDSRSAALDDIEACVQRAGGSVGGRYDRVSDAYDEAVDDSAATEMIVVFGSFPIVGGVLKHLGVPV